ncbi:hypothetical protein LJC45_00765 [Alistipes sp. OttesenSCG-928-B03]|nr:hypothetical protein [Alistipes sp. OttesenSCG-928-B03]
MKRIFHKIALLTTLAAGLAACSSESQLTSEPAPRTREMRLTIDSPSNDPNAEKIHRVRFIVFNNLTYAPKVDVNEYIEVSDGSEDIPVMGFSATLEVTEDPDKLIVAIVNEPTGAWKAVLDGIIHPSQFDNLGFMLADALNGADNPVTAAADLTPSGIPMIGMIWANIPDSALEEEEQNARPWSENITVERILARVDIFIKNLDNTRKASVTPAKTSIELYNTSTKGYMFRSYYTNGAGQTKQAGRWLTTSNSYYDRNTSMTWVPASTETINNTNGGQDGQYVCSFYMPEWQYDNSAVTAQDKLGLKFTGVLDSGLEERGGTFYLTEATLQGTGAPRTLTAIERNNVYQLTATVEPGRDFLIFGSITVAPWDEVKNIGLPIN